MTHWAKPGVRCVCINDDFTWSASMGPYSVPTRLPMINEVLTVRQVEGNSFLNTGVALTFWEIDEFQIDGPLSAKVVYDIGCFRPLIEEPSDISIFKAMLTPAGKVLADA
jgi:hypothetical protein